MIPDRELLRQYAEDQDEAAFAELVRRHIDLVYSVALRQANGDGALAQDAVQCVFIDLARKARTLSRRATLAGWLHTSARFAASNAIRGEQRRRRREQEAVIMNENAVAEVNWEHLRPWLDESVEQLSEADRDAIVLRFFQNKSHQEIGAELGLSENSANKRVERALEKLRNYFARRGVTTTAAILAGVISANSVQAAPAGLVARVATASVLAGAGQAAVGGTAGAALAAFFMSTKTKIITTSVILLLLALTMANKWWSPPDVPTPGPTPAPAAETTAATKISPETKPSALPAANPVAQVQAPIVEPAPTVKTPAAAASAEAQSATPAAAADPQIEINSAMNDFATLLESGDYATAVGTYMQLPPGMSGQQLVDSLSKNPDFPNTVQMLIDATNAAKTSAPSYNDTGDLVTYKLQTPTDGKTMVRWKKIDGKWYVDAFE